jgi:hypothetical protein
MISLQIFYFIVLNYLPWLITTRHTTNDARTDLLSHSHELLLLLYLSATCGGRDPNMVYALRRAGLRTLSLDGRVSDSNATSYGSPWCTNGPPSTTSDEKQLQQLDLHYNNDATITTSYNLHASIQLHRLCYTFFFARHGSTQRQ